MASTSEEYTTRDDVGDEAALLGFAEHDEQDDMMEESEEVQVTSKNLNVATALCRMSEAMTAMSESLRLMQQTSVSSTVESTRKRKASALIPESGHDADCEVLLAQNEEPSTKRNSEAEQLAVDPLLEEISQTLDETEKTSPIVNEKLASIINQRWLNKLSDEQLKEKQAKYFRPKNCDRLIVPKVNPEIWGKLDRTARGRDLQLSAIQSALTNVGRIAA